MNEISLFSWAHGLEEKTERHTANSNAMWCNKCYTRNMIKHNVSTDGMINSVEEEGQAICECVWETLFLKASNTHCYQMIILEFWHKPISEKCGILWEENTTNFQHLWKYLNQQELSIQETAAP